MHLVIEDLAVDNTFPAPEGMKPYFKVPDVGTFPFQAGSLKGTIEAIDYSAATYREVNAAEAEELIRNVDPFILDVRTEREFAGGHLPGATLIPVQTLQQRIGELDAQKERPVFVYCRTGNRSTVAARMLIDRGFTQVINLRRGIVEWQRAGLEIQQ
jgi:rhodanese-related sulfurtransferase